MFTSLQCNYISISYCLCCTALLTHGWDEGWLTEVVAHFRFLYLHFSVSLIFSLRFLYIFSISHSINHSLCLSFCFSVSFSLSVSLSLFLSLSPYLLFLHSLNVFLPIAFSLSIFVCLCLLFISFSVCFFIYIYIYMSFYSLILFISVSFCLQSRSIDSMIDTSISTPCNMTIGMLVPPPRLPPLWGHSFF